MEATTVAAAPSPKPGVPTSTLIAADLRYNGLLELRRLKAELAGIERAIAALEAELFGEQPPGE